MIMARLLLVLAAGIFLGVVTVSRGPVEGAPMHLIAQGAALPTEPEEFDRREVDAYYDWRNNLFFRVFKLAGGEAPPNFMTARRTYKVSVNQYGYEVAVTFPHPLFYWVDLNGNGEFEPDQGEMWIDIEEDGINGNEKPYDPMNLGDAPRGPVPVPPVPRARSEQG